REDEGRRRSAAAFCSASHLIQRYEIGRQLPVRHLRGDVEIARVTEGCVDVDVARGRIPGKWKLRTGQVLLVQVPLLDRFGVGPVLDVVRERLDLVDPL